MAISPRKPDNDPVLSLNEISAGKLITFGSRRFEIRDPMGLSLGTIKRIQRLGLEIDALEHKDLLTEDEDARLTAALGEICVAVLDAPEPVQAALKPIQRLAVVRAFIQLRSTQGAATAATKSPSTGRTSSRGSRGSMVGRRPTGTGAPPLA